MLSRAMTATRITTQLSVRRAVLWWLGRVQGDLLSQAILPTGIVDPYPIYTKLRDQDALVRSKTGGWVTARHEISREILHDRRFGVRNCGATATESDDPTGVAGRSVREVFTGGYGFNWDFSIAELDPPAHTRLRQLAAPLFGPTAIMRLRDRIERQTSMILDAALGKDEFDLMTEVATQLPVRVISDLLGVPDVDVPRIARYAEIVGASLDGIRSLRHAQRMNDALVDLHQMFAELIERATADPGDDGISRLTQALGEGKLSTQELLALASLLLMAGSETAGNLIGNGMLALLSHPDQFDLLCAKPALAPRVVEEVLRFDPPGQATARFAREDVEVAGHVLRPAQWVIVMIGATGRDPAVFPDPNRFDLERQSETEHLAFSSGVHYCLGAPLARLQGEIFFRALAERAPSLRKAGPVLRHPSFISRGLRSFPLATRC
jgi:P450-derived glycosyltransferase activator